MSVSTPSSFDNRAILLHTDLSMCRCKKHQLGCTLHASYGPTSSKGGNETTLISNSATSPLAPYSTWVIGNLGLCWCNVYPFSSSVSNAEAILDFALQYRKYLAIQAISNVFYYLDGHKLEPPTKLKQSLTKKCPPAGERSKNMRFLKKSPQDDNIDDPRAARTRNLCCRKATPYHLASGPCF